MNIEDLYSQMFSLNDQWQRVFEKLPTQKGNLIQDIRDGKISVIPGTDIKVRAIDVPGGFPQIAITKPDGTEEVVPSNGSANVITSEIVRAGMGLPKGVGVVPPGGSTENQARTLAQSLGIQIIPTVQGAQMTDAEREAQRQASGVNAANGNTVDTFGADSSSPLTQKASGGQSAYLNDAGQAGGAASLSPLPDGVSLKNPAIGQADPNSIVNPSYINALYQEALGRNATQAELDKFNGKTVKDSANLILGQSKSPFVNAVSSANQIPNADIHPADTKWINDLYNKYFDRGATSAELQNWANQTPATLEQFLSAEQKKYGYISKAAGTDNKARYDAAIAQIDASNLPDDIKSLWKTAVGLYPNATDFNTAEIMNTFNKIKSDTIDPYYKELADVAIKDVQTQVNNLNTTRNIELEAQNQNAKQAVINSQNNLEKNGMTFSGKGVNQLGTDSAYAQSGEAAPVQTPFAGISSDLNKGTVGQNNRLIATSSAAQYAANQQNIGRTAENLLGTSGLSSVNGLNYTPAGVNLTGTNAIANETKSASTLQSLIDQWRAKQQNALNK